MKTLKTKVAPDLTIKSVANPYHHDTILPFGAIFNPCPTGNCQLSCIAKFNCLLHLTDDEIRQIVENAVFDFAGTNMVLVDVQYHHLKRIKSIFNWQVIVETPYESSNGSDMVICIIKLRDEESEYDDYDDDDDDDY